MRPAVGQLMREPVETPGANTQIRDQLLVTRYPAAGADVKFRVGLSYNTNKQ